MSNNTCTSEECPYSGWWDNTPIVKEILSLRYELANRLLGFTNLIMLIKH